MRKHFFKFQNNLYKNLNTITFINKKDKNIIFNINKLEFQSPEKIIINSILKKPCMNYFILKISFNFNG